MHILLVDDNPMDVELAVNAFREVDHRPATDGDGVEFSYSISVAMGGEEARAYVAGTGQFEDRAKYPFPDLILLDLKMPGVDGCDILKEIKSAPETGGVPVIMLSSSAEEEDRLRSYEAGASSYLVKPMSFDSFTDMMGIVLSYWGRHNVRPRI